LVTALITMLFDLQHQIASLDEARERQQRFHEQRRWRLCRRARPRRRVLLSFARRRVAWSRVLLGGANAFAIILNFVSPLPDSSLYVARFADFAEGLALLLYALYLLFAYVAYRVDLNKPLKRTNYTVVANFVAAVEGLLTVSLLVPLRVWTPGASVGVESSLLYVRPTGSATIRFLGRVFVHGFLPLLAGLCATLKLAQTQALVDAMVAVPEDATVPMRLVVLAAQFCIAADAAPAVQRALVSFTYSGELSQADNYDEQAGSAAQQGLRVAQAVTNVESQRKARTEYLWLLHFNAFGETKHIASMRLPDRASRLRRETLSALTWSLSLSADGVRRSMLLREGATADDEASDDEVVIEADAEAANMEQREHEHHEKQEDDQQRANEDEKHAGGEQLQADKEDSRLQADIEKKERQEQRRRKLEAARLKREERLLQALPDMIDAEPLPQPQSGIHKAPLDCATPRTRTRANERAYGMDLGVKASIDAPPSMRRNRQLTTMRACTSCMSSRTIAPTAASPAADKPSGAMPMLQSSERKQRHVQYHRGVVEGQEMHDDARADQEMHATAPAPAAEQPAELEA